MFIKVFMEKVVVKDRNGKEVVRKRILLKEKVEYSYALVLR
mgnify:CR=1 FL=1